MNTIKELKNKVYLLEAQVAELIKEVQRLNAMHSIEEGTPPLEVYGSSIEECLQIAAKELATEIIDLEYIVKAKPRTTPFGKSTPWRLQFSRGSKHIPHPACESIGDILLR